LEITAVEDKVNARVSVAWTFCMPGGLTCVEKMEVKI